MFVDITTLFFYNMLALPPAGAPIGAGGRQAIVVAIFASTGIICAQATPAGNDRPSGVRAGPRSWRITFARSVEDNPVPVTDGARSCRSPFTKTGGRVA
jgi:hypothetical protein